MHGSIHAAGNAPGPVNYKSLEAGTADIAGQGQIIKNIAADCGMAADSVISRNRGQVLNYQLCYT